MTPKTTATNPGDRTKRRRDSGTIKNFLQEMEDLLQEVEENVGLVVEEWLPQAEDGKSLPPSYVLRLY